MAAITPLLAYATAEASNQQTLNQLAATQAIEEAQSAQSAALETESIKQEAATDKASRKAALRKAVASQKASFGAQGVSSNGGSSEAVLLGLVKDSETQQADEDATTSLKLAAIQQELEQEKALNVLQRTQLEESNTLSTISGLGDLF